MGISFEINCTLWKVRKVFPFSQKEKKGVWNFPVRICICSTRLNFANWAKLWRLFRRSDKFNQVGNTPNHTHTHSHTHIYMATWQSVANCNLLEICNWNEADGTMSSRCINCKLRKIVAVLRELYSTMFMSALCPIYQQVFPKFCRNIRLLSTM